MLISKPIPLYISVPSLINERTAYIRLRGAYKEHIPKNLTL
jgi:hypothetical protein